MQSGALWRATRAYSLPASIVPLLLGTVLAIRGYGEQSGGSFSPITFLLAFLGGILAHVGANVINDYFDYTNGVDTRPEHGSGVITGGAMTASQALTYAVALFAFAGFFGLLLLLRGHASLVLSLALVGFLCAVLYSAVLKQYGLGDLLIIISFGFGLTLGAYGVQVPALGMRQMFFVAFYSLPICLLVDAILHANNLRDAGDDRAASVQTLATRLGQRRGQQLQLVLLFGPIVLVLLGVMTRLLPLWSLATLLALPLLIRAAKSGSVEGTAQTHLVFGLLYTAAFLIKPLYL